MQKHLQKFIIGTSYDCLSRGDILVKRAITLPPLVVSPSTQKSRRGIGAVRGWDDRRRQRE